MKIWFSFLAAASLAAAAVDFQREVRPVLSNACFQCHGFDAASRKAGLRLDTREGAMRVITPGNPEASALWQRVNASSAAKRMPPVYSHKTVTAEQKETLKRWIEQGATWKEHWSFTPPVRSALPAVSNEKWAANPIDRFVLAKLDAQSLTPAPEADRRTLIRRLSFDLTGLPPEPAAVEAFVKDPSPDAYTKLVDRLLASPQWGEHRARYWLDAARYADTHGIHIDNYREMWPYRDWVIRAFNRNMPFDQFTVEQLAGDLLPNRTLDQLVATGFHRCNATTNEGGVIPEEFEAIYAKDRVDTTGAIFLGLTVGCATCHDHKFDPILQRDFYSMAAFFRNTTQKPLDGNIRDPQPVVFVPPSGEESRWTELLERERQLRAERARVRQESLARFNKAPATTATGVAKLEAPAYLLTEQAGRAAGVEWKDSAHGGGGRQLEFFAKGKLPLSPAAVGDLSADHPFTIATWVYFPAKGSQTIASRFIPTDPEDKTETKIDRNGWVFEIEDGRPKFTMLGDNVRDRVAIRAKDQLKRDAWHHVTVSYDGSRRWDGLRLFADGDQLEPGYSNDWRTLRGEIRNQQPTLLGSSPSGSRDCNGCALQDFRIFNHAVTSEDAALISATRLIEAARSKSPSAWTAAERDAFAVYYRVRLDKDAQAVAAESEKIAAQILDLRRRGGQTHVMIEKPEAPFANILYRGMYDQPRDKVTPSTPAVLPPMSDKLPRNRLGLAQWLIAPENPLLSRVTVNRFWQELFGSGIVRSSEDFGSQGEAPSHAELLDWLAVEFRESGWDVKRLFRLIVTSSTYRQLALTTPEKLQKDPQNRLLSRGPRFRMDGEMVRDLALSASGLLNPRIGGPSVNPYQPTGIWETVAMKESDTRFYFQDHGDSLYRRSLYTFWKRSAPSPAMEIFNAPTRELCTARRERTNTPLQALVVMNDPQFVEAARSLAEHAMQKAHDADSRLDYIGERILSRPLTPPEHEIVRRELKDLVRFYDSNPKEAKRLVSVGESKFDARLSLPEFAAWTMVASNILNLDEALNQ